MEYLHGVFNNANNQFVNGAVVAWMLATVTWALRAVPAMLWKLVYTNLTCKMYLYNGGWYSINGDEFQAFNTWFTNHTGFKYYRAMAIDDDNGTKSGRKEYGLSVGYGRTYFIHNYRLWWIDKELEKTQSGQQTQHASITCLTLSRSTI